MCISKGENAATGRTEHEGRAGYRLSQRRGRGQSADSGCQFTADPTRDGPRRNYRRIAALPTSRRSHSAAPQLHTAPFHPSRNRLNHPQFPIRIYIPAFLNFLRTLRIPLSAATARIIRTHLFFSINRQVLYACHVFDLLVVLKNLRIVLFLISS